MECVLFTVNLNGASKVDISHFDLLKVLGTGGECFVLFFTFLPLKRSQDFCIIYVVKIGTQNKAKNIWSRANTYWIS